MLTTIGPDVPFTPTGPYYSAFSPDGRYVYFSSALNNGGIQYFAVGSDGSLTAAGTAAVPSNGSGLSITPDGKFLYACPSTQNLYAFSIGAGGALTKLPEASAVSISCTGLAISPDGRYLLTSDSGSGIESFSIGASGVVTPAGGPILTGPNPNYIEIAPDGRNVYVLNIGSGGAGGSIAQFSIAPTGALAEVGVPVPVTATSVFANGLAISPDGRYIAASSPTSSANVHVFATNSGGQLTPVAGSPFNSGGNMGTLSPSGELFFRTNQGPSVSGLTTSGKNRVRNFVAVGAADSDGAISSYTWNFGDGTSKTTTTPNTSHSYAKGGNYNASVSVIDDANCGGADIYDGRKFLCKASANFSAAQVVDALPPSFSKLKFAKKSAKRGGKIKLKYKLSQAATVKVTFQVKKGKKYKSRGSLTFKSKAGTRSKTLKLKIKKKTLAKGTYRVLIEGTDDAKNTSSPRRLKLKIR